MQCKELEFTQEVCDGETTWNQLSWISGWSFSLLKNLLVWEIPGIINEIVIFLNLQIGFSTCTVSFFQLLYKLFYSKWLKKKIFTNKFDQGRWDWSRAYKKLIRKWVSLFYPIPCRFLTLHIISNFWSVFMCISPDCI